MIPTDVNAELEALNHELSQARRLLDLALSETPPNTHAAQKALESVCALEAERTRWRNAEHNEGVIVAGSQQEGRHRKTSTDRTDRLVDLGVHLAIFGDGPESMRRWADKWGISDRQTYCDREELWRHAGKRKGVSESRQAAADLCDAMLRLAAHVQTEMTRDEDRHLALKASMALAGTARVMMQLHSLGTQNTIEVTLRPHQDLPEDELHARIAARTQGVVIDLPT